MSAEIIPAPTEEEAAAIIAAVQALWPQPVLPAAADSPMRTPTWRFSTRWWARPLAARRDRPFR